MLICKICNKKCKSTKSLLSHVKYSHNMIVQNYYDYCYQPGKCKICGKSTNFISFKLGYRQYCSSKCAAISNETKLKREQTNLDKYGYKNISQNEIVKKKKVNTYISHVEETKEKVKSTNRQRYGCDWVTQSKEFKERYKQACLNKYGVDNYVKTDEYKNKINEKQQQNIQYMLDNDYIPLTEINMKYGTGWVQQNHDKVTTYKNKGYIHSSILSEIKQYSSRVNSKFQQEVYDYINDASAIQNTRKIIAPYELDIYIPSKQLAIECDGVYWHSQNSDSNYHLLKTELCEAKNIRLIHITDWLWYNKQDICKSIIDAALNRNQTTIFANDCILRKVSNLEAEEFLNTNYIHNISNICMNLGLYYKNQLVQIMSLGKQHKNYTVCNICTKLNTIVINGSSKLLNQINKPLITYVDRTLFTGTEYENSSWIKLKTTLPDYSYYKQNVKLLRNQIQKDLLDNFDTTKSEKHNMIDLGWSILYDCGTIVYIKEGN